jgi:hypothetical protein
LSRRDQNNIDLVALPFGTAIALRFWQGLLGVRDPLFIAIWAAAAVCEMARRIVEARRQGERPMIICHERRFDFGAVVLLGAGPWPIAAALNDKSPVGSAWHALLPEWIGAAVAMVVLGIAVRRLAETVVPRHKARRMRDLAASRRSKW